VIFGTTPYIIVIVIKTRQNPFRILTRIQAEYDQIVINLFKQNIVLNILSGTYFTRRSLLIIHVL